MRVSIKGSGALKFMCNTGTRVSFQKYEREGSIGS
jgi:hypothetical protein